MRLLYVNIILNPMLLFMLHRESLKKSGNVRYSHGFYMLYDILFGHCFIRETKNVMY